jgi:hypothetical protein
METVTSYIYYEYNTCPPLQTGGMILKQVNWIPKDYIVRAWKNVVDKSISQTN